MICEGGPSDIYQGSRTLFANFQTCGCDRVLRLLTRRDPLWTVSVISTSQAFFLLSVSRFCFPVSRPLLIFLATSNETHLSITPVTTSLHSAPRDFDHSVLPSSPRARSSRPVDWPAALINHKVSLSRWMVSTQLRRNWQNAQRRRRPFIIAQKDKGVISPLHSLGPLPH